MLAASALCFLPSHGSSPAMAVFRPHSLRCNAVLRFLQATLETCSSSQFRASRSIALSLQTINLEIICNYNSSLVNIFNCQVSPVLCMGPQQCGILSTHTNLDGLTFVNSLKCTEPLRGGLREPSAARIFVGFRLSRTVVDFSFQAFSTTKLPTSLSFTS